MLRVYNVALLPLRALAPVVAHWKMRDPAIARQWTERIAETLPSLRPGGAWIHGASVGEARIVRSLAAGLRQRLPGIPLAASAVTATGRASLPSPPDVDAAFFVPLDFPGYTRRVLEAVRPGALVIVETELWPNLLHSAAASSVPVCLVNARLSPERMARYRRFRSLYRPLLERIARIGVQSDGEAERFVELGAVPERVEITGNVKADLPVPAASGEELRRRFGLDAGRAVFVAGSTGEGEDAPVLSAFRRAREEHPGLYLVIAPRHPERSESVLREAAAQGIRLHRLSSDDDSLAGRADGLLLDRVGELAALYALSTLAFVGGSLVPIGGHNVLEPAAAGRPVLFGPHVHHVAGDAAALERAGGALRVADGEALGIAIAELVRDEGRRRIMGRNAADLVEMGRGALARTVDLVLSQLPAAPSPRAR